MMLFLEFKSKYLLLGLFICFLRVAPSKDLARFLTTPPLVPTLLITLFLLVANLLPNERRFPFKLVFRLPAGRLFFLSGTPFKLNRAAKSMRDFTFGFSIGCLSFRTLLILLLLCGSLDAAPNRCLILF